MTNISKSMGLREWLLLVLLSVLWGGSFFFVGVAVRELPAFTIVALRVIFAAVILWLVVLLGRIKVAWSPRVWIAFLIMGLLNNVIPFSLIVSGQKQIASGLASILNATTPLFTVMLAALFLKDEKITGNKVLGIVAGFIGVAVLLGFDALKSLTGTTLAQLFILLAAFAYGLAGVYGRRFRAMNVDPLFTATGQLTASSVVMIPLVMALEGVPDLKAIDREIAWSILGLAALSTALAYLIYFQILATAGATNLLLVTFLIPVSAILLGYLFLGERLNPNHYMGMLIIGISLIAIDGRLLRWLAKLVREQPNESTLADD